MKRPLDYPRMYEEDALPGFSAFRYYTRKGVDLASMKDFDYLPESRAAFNAFARRFRLAKAMQPVVFKGYREGTSNGYAALNRHFLMFSAFERYTTDCEGLEHGAYHRALQFVSDAKFKEIKVAFDMVDTNDVIYKFLLSNCTSKQQTRSLQEFREGQSVRKGMYISSMLRNSFVHGVLSANPSGAPKKGIEYLANFMADFLFEAIRDDFQKRLESVEYVLQERGKQ